MERRPKHWGSPKIRCRKHQTHPSTLFFPIFSLAREKIGPPEARQKRPRRNESLQARLLILCARFFLSKPQTEFAVWVFSMQICNNLSGAARQLPWEGSLFQRQIIWKRASLVASASGWNWTPSIWSPYSSASIVPSAVRPVTRRAAAGWVNPRGNAGSRAFGHGQKRRHV